MKDNVIEQAADELARVMTSPRSYCVLLAEALAEAGLLRPEIDDAMIERAARGLFIYSYPNLANAWGSPIQFGRDLWLAKARAVLEAALGGESA